MPDNVYENGEPIKLTLNNNTRANLSANMGKCKIAIETDNDLLAYTDDEQDYHTITGVDGKIILDEGATPPTPVSGKITIYADGNDGNQLKVMDGSGNIFRIALIRE